MLCKMLFVPPSLPCLLYGSITTLWANRWISCICTALLPDGTLLALLTPFAWVSSCCLMPLASKNPTKIIRTSPSVQFCSKESPAPTQVTTYPDCRRESAGSLESKRRSSWSRIESWPASSIHWPRPGLIFMGGFLTPLRQRLVGRLTCLNSSLCHSRSWSTSVLSGAWCSVVGFGT